MVAPSSQQRASEANAHIQCRKRTKLKKSWDKVVLLLLSLALVASTTLALDASCRAELVKADKNNDARINREEYVNAVKRLSGEAFGDTFSFENLPVVLRETFEKLSCRCHHDETDVSCCREEFASIDLIPLKHRIPGHDSICDEINNSIRRAFQAPAPAPVMTGPLVYPCPSMLSDSRHLQTVSVSFPDCVLAMNSADTNKDNFLNQNEYMAFVNELSGDAYQGETLATVPLLIRRNFFQLAGDNGQIDIAGSKPDDDRTDAQIENLQNVCTSTENAINAADGPSAPTVSPTAGAPAASPVLSPTDCFIAMNRADVNKNSQLNQNEYFTFVNIVSGGAFSGLSFPELNVTLRQNFFMWRDEQTNQINIFGSKPGEDADPAQMEFLDMVCTETENDINNVLNPTAAPNGPPTVAPTTASAPPTAAAPTTAIPSAEPPSTVLPSTAEPTTVPPTTEAPTVPTTISPGVEPTVELTTTPPKTVAPEPTQAPTTPPPTTPPLVTQPPTTSQPTTNRIPGNLTIPSDFIISNTADLNADDITGSQNEVDLKEAYNNLVEDVVAGLDGRRRLRQRRLTVTYIENSATIASITDASRCPMGTPEGTQCQMVLAFYQVAAIEEDIQSVTEDLTTATEVAINTGLLQEELNMVNPDTPIDVVRRPLGPTMPTAAPSSAPSGGDGLSNGAIAGIAVAGFVAVAGLGVALFYAQRRHVPPKKKPLGGDVDLDSVNSGFGGPGKVRSMRPSQANSGAYGTAQAEAVAATEHDDGDEDDDYSFQSGSFYETSGSTSQSPVTQACTTVSQIQDYKFDDVTETKPHGAATAGAAAGAAVVAAGAKQYESSSNAGSSGWSSSEEDTDYSDKSSSDYSSAWSEAESNDSFFNNKNVTAESREQFFDDPAQQPSAGSDSYDDSFSSDYSPQPATPPEAERSKAAPVPVPIPMPSRSDEESSESYTSSDDSSYESTFEGKENRIGSGVSSIPSAALHDSSTALTGGKYSEGAGNRSVQSHLQESLNERATELEELVEQGDWEGVIASAQKFEVDTEAANTPSSHGSRRIGESSSSDSVSESSSGGSSYTSSGTESESSSSEPRSPSETSGETGRSFETSGSTEYTVTSTTSETPEEARRREEYRAEVEALVRIVVPEEIDNVDVMMVQFRGREAELVSTLRNMQGRSHQQRARAAVHKSKDQPLRRDAVPGQYRRDGNYSTDSRMRERTEDTHGSAAGSAAIAAASVPRPAAGGRVPIHPPPVPAHESTQLESLGSSTTPSAESTSGSLSESGSTIESQSASRSLSQNQSVNPNQSHDSQTRGSGSMRTSGSSSSASSSGSSSGSNTGSSSGSSSSGSYSEKDEYYTSQGTGANYESQGTSHDTSQGTSYTSQGGSMLGEPLSQRKRSINTNNSRDRLRGEVPSNLG